MSEAKPNEEAAPFVDADQPTNPTESVKEQTPSTQPMTASVQNTAEQVRQQIPSAEQVRQQIPSAESVTQHLPSAQNAVDTVKQGVSSLASGLGSLIGMATSTTAPKVTTGEKPKDPSDLHVPGGFDGTDHLTAAPASSTQQQKSISTESQVDPPRDQDVSLESAQAARPDTSTESQVDPPRDQDVNLESAQAARPDTPDSSSVTSNLPGSSSVAAAEEVAADRQEKKYNLDHATPPSTGSSSLPSRVPASELQSLPKDEQDINLEETAAARPGADVENATSQDTPVGVDAPSTAASIVHGSSATTSNQTIGEQLAAGAESVKQAVGSGAQYVSESLPSQQQIQETAQNAGKVAYNQIPSTQAVKETAQNSAQSVSDSLPSQQQVQETARSAGQTAYSSLPSQQAVNETAQNSAQYVSDSLPSQAQVQETARSAAQTAYNSLPSQQAVNETAQNSAQYASDSTPSQAPVEETTRNAGQAAYDTLPSTQAVKDTAQNSAQYVSQSLPSQAQVQENISNAGQAAYNTLPSTQGVKETAQSGAQYAADSAQAGAQYTKEATQNAAQYAADTARSGDKLASEQLGTAPVLPADNRTKTMQAVTDEVMTGESQRPLHAGAAPDIPRNTIESTAQPDVSYEHRPKTLPQTEIAEREKDRSVLDSAAGAPDRVVASHRAAHSGLEAAGSAEAVHDKSEVEKELLQNVAPAPADSEAFAAGSGVRPNMPAAGAGTDVVGNWDADGAGILGASATTTTGVSPASGYPAVGTAQHPQSGLGQGGVFNTVVAHGSAEPQHSGILAGGVYNGVIGHGSGELQPSVAHASAAQSAVGGTPAILAGSDSAERIVITDPDLTAGVHNGVVGAGSGNGP